MNLASLVSRIPESWRKSVVNVMGGAFHSASDSPSRSSTVWFPFDSSREIDPRERVEMVKKHRSLRNNLGVVRGIINTTARLSIGWGLLPAPASGNKDYDRRALAYYRRNTRKQDYDVSGQDNGASMQRLVFRETVTDGQIYGIKAFDALGRPQRQLIKTENVGNPADAARSSMWRDGHLLNAQRRPLKYGIRQDALEPNGKAIFVPVDARHVLHVYDKERATQTHGLPWGYTGLNHGIDAIDTLAFEKIAHKLNTAIVGAMTTPTGSVNDGMARLLSATKEAAAANATQTSAQASQDGTRFLDLHGSQIPIFKTGEGMNFFPGRDSVSAIEFTGALFAQYAHGFGLPVEFVTGMIAGGANVRGNSDLAGRFFEECQMMMIDDWCQPDYENIIGTGILASRYPRDYPMVEPLDPPPGYTGWDAVEWRGPKNITMDKGREGKTYLDLKRAGWMTDDEYWTASGENPDEMTVRIDEELAERRRRWMEDYKLPEDMFWVREFGTNIGNQSAQAGAEPVPSDGK